MKWYCTLQESYMMLLLSHQVLDQRPMNMVILSRFAIFFIYLFLYCLTYIKNKELRKISTSNHAVSIILAVDRQSLVSTSIFTSSRLHQYLWSNNCISHSSLCCYIVRRTLFIIAPHWINCMCLSVQKEPNMHTKLLLVIASLQIASMRHMADRARNSI